MITPIYEEHEPIEDDVHTRINLRSIDNTKYEQRLREFSELPDTLLLFLSRLTKLTVNIYGTAALQSVTEYYYHLDKNRGIAELRKRSGPPNSVHETVTTFHITRRQLKDLPHDDARQGIREAEVS